MSYLGWFGAVYFAKWNLSVESFIFPILSYGVLLRGQNLNFKQFLFLIAACTIGISFDSLMASFQFISFPLGSQGPIPMWLVSMWFLFSTVIFLVSPLFENRLWGATLLGAFFGPLTYFSGEKFEVLHFVKSETLAYYALFWSVYFPGLFWVNRTLKWK